MNGEIKHIHRQEESILSKCHIPQIMYKLNAIPIKIPTGCVWGGGGELDKLISKFL